MDTSELLRRAWEAVKASGVPESLQEAAFREAVEDLRAGEGGASTPAGERQQDGRSTGGTRGRRRSSTSRSTNTATEATGVSVDEDTFFAQLAQESGVPESDLRDVLSYSGGTVHVTPPARTLGSSAADQARAVIALVAGARSFGMGERPVSADAVRAELERKRCYQSNNFAAKHLGPLRGFNAGATRTEIVTTSRWVGEFTDAVNQALGRTGNEDPT